MINLQKFYEGYRQRFGPLRQGQVNGLDFLLKKFDCDPRWDDYRHIAYALASIKHETANTYQPIEERGRLKYFYKYYLKPGIRKALGNIKLSDSYTFKGRGYIQITGRANYTRFAKLLNKPLVEQPELALDPEVSYEIMTLGMHGGLFTGKKLLDYIHGTKTDNYNARRIINRLDKAAMISDHALNFAAILWGAMR